MKKAIIGKKLGMTQIFTENGTAVPVTVVEAGPCTVTQIKTKDKDGYESVQVAFCDCPEKSLTKPELGHLDRAGVKAKRFLRELKLDDSQSYEVGKDITVEIFAIGDKVDVAGITRGRGFTGSIQRWNQSRLKMSHGTGPTHREVGSLGANSTPSRVLKGRNMPGHYGHERVTVQNLEIVKVDTGRNLLLIRGGIPGPKGGLVTVRTSVK